MLRMADSGCLPLLAKEDCDDYTARSLYIRLPCTIKSKEDVEEHLIGNDYTLRLNRQSGRHCTVVFSSVEEKLRNLKALKNTLINGKPLIVRRLTPHLKKSSPKKPRKKVRVPKIKKDVRITQTLFITNIKCGVSVQEVKEALPGCINVTFLKAYNKNCRSAMVKMENLQLARDYLIQKKECPEIGGFKLKAHPDTRCKHKRKKELKTDLLVNNVNV